MNLTARLEELLLDITQFLPSTFRRAMQWRRLKALAIHTYENIPIYKELWSDANCNPYNLKDYSQWLTFPLITRGALRLLPQDRYIAKSEYLPERAILRQTSGTSGIPLEVIVDRKYLPKRKAFLYRALRWAGIASYERIVVFKQPRYIDEFTNMLFLSVVDFQKHRYQYYQQIRNFGGAAIRGGAIYLHSLAQFCKKDGAVDLRFTAAFSKSYPLLPNMRREIESVFQCPVFDTYASWEFGVLAQECEFHNGLHINEEGFLIEILDESDQLVAEGETGRIIITSLWNDIMPLIRYEIGDKGKIIRGQCQCGRQLSRLIVDGREEEFLRRLNGTIVSPVEIRSVILKHSSAIERFQVIQESYENVILKIKPSPTYNDEIKTFLIEGIKRLMGLDVNVDIQAVDGFPLQHEGKFKVIISEIPKL